MEDCENILKTSGPVKNLGPSKWISVEDKLPEVGKKVFVKRELRFDDLVIPIEDVGVLNGTNNWDRWALDSQEHYILPLKPTLSSKIVTHWKEIPKKESAS